MSNLEYYKRSLYRILGNSAGVWKRYIKLDKVLSTKEADNPGAVDNKTVRHKESRMKRRKGPPKMTPGVDQIVPESLK